MHLLSVQQLPPVSLVSVVMNNVWTQNYLLERFVFSLTIGISIHVKQANVFLFLSVSMLGHLVNEMSERPKCFTSCISSGIKYRL